MIRKIRSAVMKHKLEKLVKKTEEARKKQVEGYISSTPEELLELSDENLLDAVLIRITNKINRNESQIAGVKCLSEEQRIFYSVVCFQKQINKGGLCQFFINTSRVVAPMLSDYLKAIKAPKHKKIYDAFVKNNKIDLEDLSSFAIEYYQDYDTEYDERKKRYPFDDFDKEFYKLGSLEKHLFKYIRENISNF